MQAGLRFILSTLEGLRGAKREQPLYCIERIIRSIWVVARKQVFRPFMGLRTFFIIKLFAVSAKLSCVINLGGNTKEVSFVPLGMEDFLFS